MALGGGGLAQGGTGLVWARLAAPRMGLVGLAEPLGWAWWGLPDPSDGLGGTTVGWAPRPMGLEDAPRPPPCATLAPLPPNTQVSPQFEPFPSSFQDNWSPNRDKFSHNPNALKVKMAYWVKRVHKVCKSRPLFLIQ